MPDLCTAIQIVMMPRDFDPHATIFGDFFRNMAQERS
jgi:hypothetical protein